VQTSVTLFYSFGMERIGVRQLNQATSAVLARVKQGETFEVTDRGEPVARLTPIPGEVSALARAVAEGLLIPATDHTPFPLPPVIGDPNVDVGGEIAAARERERY
jgi:prevent-host-death family protein